MGMDVISYMGKILKMYRYCPLVLEENIQLFYLCSDFVRLCLDVDLCMENMSLRRTRHN